jgi:hypothetical protein
MPFINKPTIPKSIFPAICFTGLIYQANSFLALNQQRFRHQITRTLGSLCLVSLGFHSCTFSLCDCVWLPFTVIDHSHEYNYMWILWVMKVIRPNQMLYIFFTFLFKEILVHIHHSPKLMCTIVNFKVLSTPLCT